MNVSTARNVSNPVKMKFCVMLRLCETLHQKIKIKIEDIVIGGLLF
jgi:hypothetical protein